MGELAIIETQDQFEVIKRTGAMLAMSGYFDASGNQNQAVAQMATKVLAGRELGFGPFASVNGIHIIKGKPAIGANLLASAIKGHPRYDYRVIRLEDSICVIDFFERHADGTLEKIGTSKFDSNDASKAGTKNMGAFPRNMLFARAISNGARWYCPDVFSGNAVYVPEELGAEVDGEGNVIGERVNVERVSADRPAIVDNGTQTVQGEIVEEDDDIDFYDNPFNDKPADEPKPTASKPTQSGQCPHCYAPEGKPHAKNCPTTKQAQPKAQSAPKSNNPVITFALADNSPLSDPAIEMVEEYRAMHDVSRGTPMTLKMYNSLRTLIPMTLGDTDEGDAHKVLLSCLCGEEVDSKNLPGGEIGKLRAILIDPDKHKGEIQILQQIFTCAHLARK